MVAVNSTTNWTQIGVATLGFGKRAGLMTLIVGSGGALGHFKLTRADRINGLHVDWLIDTDFNSTTAGLSGK